MSISSKVSGGGKVPGYILEICPDAYEPAKLEQSTAFIYVLIDPETEAVRYVGKTNDLLKRLYWHENSVNDWNNVKGFWVQGLAERGLKPRMIVIEEVQKSFALQAEKNWTNFFLDKGYTLFIRGEEITR